jgi:hypothetical protein
VRWPDHTWNQYFVLLLNCLAADDTVEPAVAARVMVTIAAASRNRSEAATASIVRCGLRFLGREASSDLTILDTLRKTIEHLGKHRDRNLIAEAEVRIAERVRVQLAAEDQKRLVDAGPTLDKLERLVNSTHRQDLLARVRHLRESADRSKAGGKL